MRADFALLALGMLPGAGHQFTDSTIGALRAQKDEGEYRTLKMNARIDDGDRCDVRRRFRAPSQKHAGYNQNRLQNELFHVRDTILTPT